MTGNKEWLTHDHRFDNTLFGKGSTTNRTFDHEKSLTCPVGRVHVKLTGTKQHIMKLKLWEKDESIRKTRTPVPEKRSLVDCGPYHEKRIV